MKRQKEMVSDRGRGLRLKKSASQKYKGEDSIGACVSTLICVAREKSNAAGERHRDMETDRVILCGAEPGPVMLTGLAADVKIDGKAHQSKHGSIQKQKFMFMLL